MTIGELWNEYSNQYSDGYDFQKKLMKKMHDRYMKDMENAFYEGYKKGIEYVFTEIIQNIK